MDRAATLPCPMMVVGVVMDAAPPNQSEATSAAFMEAPASEGGVRLSPWQARTAHRRQPHDEGEAAADREDAGVCWRRGEAKPDRACSPEIVSPAMFHKKEDPCVFGSTGFLLYSITKTRPEGAGGLGGWGIGSRLHFHQQTNKASPPSKFTSEFCKPRNARLQ
jgi:hypothetical protein